MSSPPDPPSAPALNATELAEYEALAESEWRALGIADIHIRESRRYGMDAQDIATLTDVTRAPPVLIVIRCPKVQARSLHRVVRRPKSLTVKVKSDAVGVVRTAQREYISDYDLMSVWRIDATGRLLKLRIAPKDKPVPLSKDEPWRGAFSVEAVEFMRSINNRLVSKFQHGCQDDMPSVFNPGVSKTDHFAYFMKGACDHLPDWKACRDFYARQHIPWPYGIDGRYTISS